LDQEAGVASLPRCPFAGASGLQIHGCPGFEPATVAAGDIEGMAGAYETCCFLGAEADGRGFYPACHHPEAERVVPTARLLVDADSMPAKAAS
jgi:hypothetical protein